jgi:hypothetical protein
MPPNITMINFGQTFSREQTGIHIYTKKSKNTSKYCFLVQQCRRFFRIMSSFCQFHSSSNGNFSNSCGSYLRNVFVNNRRKTTSNIHNCLVVISKCATKSFISLFFFVAVYGQVEEASPQQDLLSHINWLSLINLQASVIFGPDCLPDLAVT